MNSLSGGSNFNVRRTLGALGLSGGFETKQKRDEATDSLEDFNMVGNFIGTPGKGLYYFLSDYDNMCLLEDTINDSYDVVSSVYPLQLSNDYANSGHIRTNWRLGQKATTKNPTEYYVFTTRRANNHAYDVDVDGEFCHGTTSEHHNHVGDVSGNISRSYNIYELDRKLAKTNDASNNGMIYNWHMGSPQNTQLEIGSDATFSSDYFQVFYQNKGNLIICDGSFGNDAEGKPVVKTWHGYVKNEYSGEYNPHTTIYPWASNSPYVGQSLASYYDDFTVETNYDPNTSPYTTDNWVVDWGDVKNRGLLQQPKVIAIANDHGEMSANMIGSGKDDYIIVNNCTEVSSAMCNSSISEGLTFWLGMYHNILNVNAANNSHCDADSNKKGTTIVNIRSQKQGAANCENDAGYIDLEQSSEQDSHTGWSLYFSYVYDDGEESKLTKCPELTTFHDGYSSERSGFPLSNYIYGENLFFDIEFYVSTHARRPNPRVNGIRMYIASGKAQSNDIQQTASKDLVAEMNYEKGCRAAGTRDYIPWMRPGGALSMGGGMYTKCRVTSLGLESFDSLHGYENDDIGACFYKTAVTLNNQVYVGNVKFKDKLYPDRMMKTMPGEACTFHENGFIDVTTDDGDSIIHLEVFGDRILQFKENVVYVINCSKQYEYLENEFKYAGIKSPCQVVTTDKGVFWANECGFYFYNGQDMVNLFEHYGLTLADTGPTISSTSKFTIRTKEWTNIVSEENDNNPVLTFDPITRDVYVLLQQDYHDSNVEDIGFIWNIDRKSFIQLFGKSSKGRKSNSIVNIDRKPMYIDIGAYASDWSSMPSTPKLMELTSSPIASSNDPFLLLETKLIDFGNHSSRKSIYSVSFTYKADGNTFLIPYIKGYFKHGEYPSVGSGWDYTFYLAESSSSAITASTVAGASYQGHLDNTGGVVKTHTFEYLLNGGNDGTPVTIKSVFKKAMAIKIGLVKLHSAATHKDFELEDISITYRDKRIR